METFLLKKRAKTILVAFTLVVSITLLTCCRNESKSHQTVFIDPSEKPLLTFGEATFVVNVNEDNITLISSTSVDDPNVIPIVNYLNDIYGEAQGDEPSNYWWSTDGHNNMFGSTIRLRPLHSEYGGTVIMVY